MCWCDGLGTLSSSSRLPPFLLPLLLLPHSFLLPSKPRDGKARRAGFLPPARCHVMPSLPPRTAPVKFPSREFEHDSPRRVETNRRRRASQSPKRAPSCAPAPDDVVTRPRTPQPWHSPPGPRCPHSTTEHIRPVAYQTDSGDRSRPDGCLGCDADSGHVVGFGVPGSVLRDPGRVSHVARAKEARSRDPASSLEGKCRYHPRRGPPESEHPPTAGPLANCSSSS